MYNDASVKLTLLQLNLAQQYFESACLNIQRFINTLTKLYILKRLRWLRLSMV